MNKEIKVGDMAPAINAKDQNGDMVSLDQFKGKKVALYFYPKDDTPGCTAEACNFRDHYQNLKSQGVEVIGVSADHQKSHQKFAAKHQLPFTLLADTDKKIVNDYGVWAEKNMYGNKYMGINRYTFIIDQEGKIVHIIKKVDVKRAVQQILDLLK